MASAWVVGTGDTPEAAIVDRDAQVDALEQQYHKQCKAMGLLVIPVTVRGETDPRQVGGQWVAACNVHT